MKGEARTITDTNRRRSYGRTRPKLGDLRKPALPPGLPPEDMAVRMDTSVNFIESILKGTTPIVNIAVAQYDRSRIVAHMSALKDGEPMNIPQYTP